MEYVGWIDSGGFKYSLPASNGIDKTIGFALADSILIDCESVMYSNEHIKPDEVVQQMHDLFFPFYSVGIEPKVNTGTFDVAKVLIFS